MGTVTLSSYNDNNSDYSSNQLGLLINDKLNNIEVEIQMLEINLNSFMKEIISKSQFENSMKTSILMLRNQLQIIKTHRLEIKTDTRISIEVK